MWDITLRKLHDIRVQLMSGLGHVEMRQAVWEKQFWKGADEEADQKLDFDDVERMCRRLNINPSRDDLLRRFKVGAFCDSIAPFLTDERGHTCDSKQTFRTGATSTSTTSEDSSRDSKRVRSLTGCTRSSHRTLGAS